MPRIELTGLRFGRYTVLSEAPKRANWVRYWFCQCDCGNIQEVFQGNLISGKSIGCGCLRVTHGHTGTYVYRVWHGIHSRCKYLSNVGYKDYGGRGISVCERWNDFSSFLADMGYPPSEKHTVDRENSDGPYSPENCRWATRKEQARNRSNNSLITFKDRTLTQVEWAEITGLSTNMIRKRLSRGWSVESALTTPAQKAWAKPHAA